MEMWQWVLHCCVFVFRIYRMLIRHAFTISRLHDRTALLLALLQVPLVFFCAERTALLPHDALYGDALIAFSVSPSECLLQGAVHVVGADLPCPAADFHC